MGIRSRMYFANETSCIEEASSTNEVTNDSTPMYLAFPVEHVKAIRLYASKPFLELHTGRTVNLPHKFLHGQLCCFTDFNSGIADILTVFYNICNQLLVFFIKLIKFFNTKVSVWRFKIR